MPVVKIDQLKVTIHLEVSHSFFMWYEVRKSREFGTPQNRNPGSKSWIKFLMMAKMTFQKRFCGFNSGIFMSGF